MGKIVKELGEGVTKYYWYPGAKSDWIKTVIALAAGGLTFLLTYVVTKNGMLATVLGTSVTTGVVGAHIGRRDVVALKEFHDMSGERRAAIADSGRAVWRGMILGFTYAGAVVLVANLPASGFAANWLLPIVPAAVGTLAHAAGMITERMAQFSKEHTQAAQQWQSDDDAVATTLLERAS